MFKRMVVLLILCVCALTVVSAAQERVPVRTDLQHQFDRNRDGFIGPDEQAMLREFSEARERIEGLREEARQIEERAGRLRAEAEEIERSINRRFRGAEPAEQMEGMKRHIAELKEAAARAQREGRRDEAERSEERRVGKECRSRWSPYH